MVGTDACVALAVGAYVVLLVVVWALLYAHGRQARRPLP